MVLSCCRLWDFFALVFMNSCVGVFSGLLFFTAVRLLLASNHFAFSHCYSLFHYHSSRQVAASKKYLGARRAKRQVITEIITFSKGAPECSTETNAILTHYFHQLANLKGGIVFPIYPQKTIIKFVIITFSRGLI